MKENEIDEMEMIMEYEKRERERVSTEEVDDVEYFDESNDEWYDEDKEKDDEEDEEELWPENDSEEEVRCEEEDKEGERVEEMSVSLVQPTPDAHRRRATKVSYAAE